MTTVFVGLRIRGSEHKPKQELPSECQEKERGAALWHNLLREVLGAPTYEITDLHIVLSNLILVVQLEEGGWTG